MIHVTGIGPGAPRLLLQAAREEIEAADLIIGSRRQLAVVDAVVEDGGAGQRVLLPALADLEGLLRDHPEENVCLLASGDPLFFGIGSWIASRFPEGAYEIIPGISSVAYFFARTGLAMNEVYLTSTHGREPDWERILALPTVAMVTDAKLGPWAIAQKALAAGLDRWLYIGENLSYPDERITCLRAQDVEDRDYAQNVVILRDRP